MNILLISICIVHFLSLLSADERFNQKESRKKRLFEMTDDIQGPYCETRPEQQCCPGRDDNCTVPMLDTLCYCDRFCTETADDCCPDFWHYCTENNPYSIDRPGETCMPTSPDIWGPYYISTPPFPLLKQFCVAEKDFNQHKSLLVHGYVYSADCKTPLQSMRIEVWQADHNGRYMVTDLCRGYLVTDKNGYYEFTTINPGKYTIDPLHKEFRPAHLHFHVVGGQGHKGLVTQMYFRGDTNLGRNDSCSACSSDKPDLITDPWGFCGSPFDNCVEIVRFDIVLAKGKGTSVITR